MPNGGSWDRFWFVLLGFFGEFGQWPTRVVVPRPVQSVLASLPQSDLAKLKAKLDIVEGDELTAQDGTGREYRYQGPVEGRPSGELQEWLGVKWS
jgi:hypothetical protein